MVTNGKGVANMQLVPTCTAQPHSGETLGERLTRKTAAEPLCSNYQFILQHKIGTEV